MIGLTRNTAGKLESALRRVDRPAPGVRPAGGAVTGQIPVLVACTSATAANGLAEGGQCYPGVILRGQAGLAEPVPRGLCWLTVYGDDGAAGVPAEGQVYVALLGGQYDPDPDGDSDGRPRAFAAAGAGGGGNPPILVKTVGSVPATGPADESEEFSVIPGPGNTGAYSYWSLPAQPARSGIPGWMTAGGQAISGEKVWEDHAEFEDGITVNEGWSSSVEIGDTRIDATQAVDVGGQVAADGLLVPGITIGFEFGSDGVATLRGLRFTGDPADPVRSDDESTSSVATLATGLFTDSGDFPAPGRNLYVRAGNSLYIDLPHEPDPDPGAALYIRGHVTRQYAAIRLPGNWDGVASGVSDPAVYEHYSGILATGDGLEPVAPARAAVTVHTPVGSGGSVWTNLMVPAGGGKHVLRGLDTGVGWHPVSSHLAEALAELAVAVLPDDSEYYAVSISHGGGAGTYALTGPVVSGTYSIGGGGSGDVASITVTRGVITAVGLVP